MKKSSLFLSLLSVFALTACGVNTPSSSSATTSTPPSSSSTSEDTRKFTLSFNSGGGIGEMDSIVTNKASDFKVTLPDCTFVKSGYEFENWKDGNGTAHNVGDVLTLTADLVLTATWDQIDYTVTFLDDDEETEISKKEDYHYGDALVKPADPTKAATAQYTYTFAGWDKEVPETVASDLTFIATYTKTVNKYTIRFVNGEEVLQEDELEYGTTPTYEGETPTKDSDAEHTYVFESWDKEVVDVVADATYTATFTPTKRSYVITFLDGDGKVVQEGQVEYGATPKYTGATPTKTATAEYSYTFKGWDKEIVPVTGIATYTAQFDKTVRTYTVSFDSDEGSEVAPITDVEYGKTITAPANPAKDGYTFGGWYKDKEYKTEWDFTKDVVEGDVTLYAKWDVISYSIAYDLKDGEVGEENPVTYNADSDDIILNNPTKDGYVFVGWTGSNGETPQKTVTIEQGSTGNKSYTAHWGYTITWKDGDTVLATTDVEEGDTPVYPKANPTKEADEQYTYTFDGWDPAIEEATANATYIAKYATTINKYTVSFESNGGTAIDPIANVDYGSKIDEPTEPSKTGYSFGGWYKDAGCQTAWNFTTDEVKGNVALYAKWTPVSYTIGYELDGGSVASENPTSYTIESGEITLVNPTQEGFVFVGWSGTDLTGNNNMEVVIPAGSTGDRSYVAHWGYSITYELHNGTIEGGTNPTFYTADSPEIVLINPTRVGYEFQGWSGTDIAGTSTHVVIAQGSTGNRSYEAIFAISTYTIGYTLDGGSVEGNPATYNVETNSITLINPTKAGYTFVGWSGTDLTGDNNMTVVIPNGSTGNRSYVAHWAINHYTVTIRSSESSYGKVDGEAEVVVADVPYGTEISVNGKVITIGVTEITAAEVDDTAQYDYAFVEWTGVVASVQDNLTITATFSRTLQKYTVTVVSSNADYGTVDTATINNVPYGTEITNDGQTVTVNGTVVTATETEDTAQYDYSFVNWTNGTATVNGNLTITANFSRALKSYTVTVASSNADYGTVDTATINNVPYGTEITSVDNVVTIGTAEPTNVTATATAADAQYTYSFTGWTNGSTTVTGNLTVTANFSATPKTYTVTYLDKNDQAYSGSAIDDGKKSYTYGTGLTLPTVTKDGHDFAGWFDNAECTSDPVTSISDSDTGNKTFYAKWNVHKFTVVIACNENEYGTVDVTVIDNVEYGTAVTKNGNVITIGTTTITATPSDNTSQYSYAFVEWADVGDTITEATGIGAIFSRTLNSYTVKFNANSGTPAPVDQQINYDGKVTDPGEITKADHTFGGWYVNPQFSGSAWNFENNKVHEAITLYAKWTATITYKDEGNQVYSGSTISDAYTSYTCGVAFALPNEEVATKTGYDFAGWFDNDDCTGDPVTTIASSETGPKTYYAKWTIKKFTVTVVSSNTDYGTVDTATINNVPYGTVITNDGKTVTVNGTVVTATETEDTAQYDYEFTSWTNGDATVEGNLTITANFSRALKSYTVTVASSNTDYGKVNTAASVEIADVPYGTEITSENNVLTVNTETPTVATATSTTDTDYFNYSFTGWSDATASVQGNLTITANFEAVGLYTIWKKDTVEGEYNRLDIPNIVPETYSDKAVFSNLSLANGNVIKIMCGDTQVGEKTISYNSSILSNVVHQAGVKQNNEVWTTISYADSVYRIRGIIQGAAEAWGTNYSGVHFVINPSNNAEYMLSSSIELYAGDQIKVVSADGNNWYPGGENNNYYVNETGVYQIYFDPNGNRDGWHGGYFFLSKINFTVTFNLTLGEGSTTIPGIGLIVGEANNNQHVKYNDETNEWAANIEKTGDYTYTYTYTQSGYGKSFCFGFFGWDALKFRISAENRASYIITMVPGTDAVVDIVVGDISSTYDADYVPTSITGTNCTITVSQLS